MTTEVAKATPVRAERAALTSAITSLPHLWIVVAVACLAAFTALQFCAEWRSNSGWTNDSRTGPLSRYSDWSAIRYEFAGDVARYVALSLASLTLVVRGRRGLFWVPAVAYVAAPLLFGWGDRNCQILGRFDNSTWPHRDDHFAETWARSMSTVHGRVESAPQHSSRPQPDRQQLLTEPGAARIAMCHRTRPPCH